MTFGMLDENQPATIISLRTFHGHYDFVIYRIFSLREIHERYICHRVYMEVVCEEAVSVDVFNEKEVLPDTSYASV